MRKLIPVLLLISEVAIADAPSGDTGWRQATAEDDSGRGEMVTLYRDAANTIRDESATLGVTPRLSFRCTPGDPALTARIDWRRFISSFSTEVGFKVEGGRFTWLKWKTDDSEQVTLSPSADDTARLIGMMSAGTRLIAEVSPYSEAPVEASFDLAGFDEALLAFKDACR